MVFALAAFFGWGVGNIFGGVVSRKIGGHSAVFWQYIFTLIITSFYVPFAIGDLAKFDQSAFILTVSLNVFGFIPVMALYKGIQVGNAMLTGTISSAFAALVVVFSVLFLGDHLSTVQALAVAVIFVGLLLSSLELKGLKLKSVFTDRAIPFALVAMLGWGIYFTFIRIPVRQVGWFWPSYFGLLSLPVLWTYLRVRKLEIILLKERRTLLYSILGAVIINGAVFSYNFAITQGQTAIVAPIAGSYPVLFVVLSKYVFKDKISGQQFLGIAITLAGIVCLAFLSV